MRPLREQVVAQLCALEAQNSLGGGPRTREEIWASLKWKITQKIEKALALEDEDEPLAVSKQSELFGKRRRRDRSEDKENSQREMPNERDSRDQSAPVARRLLTQMNQERED